MNTDEIVRALRQNANAKTEVSLTAAIMYYAADLIETLQAQLAERDREIERLQNIISSPAVAYMSSPIGDLPIDSTGMRKAVDEIARLTEAQRWIPVSERVPTLDDADSFCEVEVLGDNGVNRCRVMFFDQVDTSRVTHWRRTDLITAAAPDHVTDITKMKGAKP